MCEHERQYTSKFVWDKVVITCLDCKKVILTRLYTQDDYNQDNPKIDHYQEYLKFQRMIDTWD